MSQRLRSRHKSNRLLQSINMKSFTVALLVVLAAAVLARPEEKYTDQYDNVDIDEILNSDRLLASYMNCLKTGKKCTPDGQTLREVLPDALQTGCSKCSEIQKTRTKKVIEFLVKNKPAEFKELEQLYDPEGIYRVKYADDIKKEGIVLPD